MSIVNTTSSQLNRLQALVQDAQRRTIVPDLIPDYQNKVRDLNHQIASYKSCEDDHDARIQVLDAEAEALRADQATLTMTQNTVQSLQAKLSVKERDALNQELALVTEQLRNRENELNLAISQANRDLKREQEVIYSMIVEYKTYRAQLESMGEVDALNVEGIDMDEIQDFVENFKGLPVWEQVRQLYDEVQAAKTRDLFRYEGENAPYSGQEDQLLRKKPIYYQMKIWLGTFRKLQDEIDRMNPEEVYPEGAVMMSRIHPALSHLSKEYYPGHIPEFRRDSVPTMSWDDYIEEAREGYDVSMRESQQG